MSIEPFAETTVTAPQTASVFDFTITVIDPNPADTLYVRWVSDYPIFTANSVLLADDPKGVPQDGPQGTIIKYPAQCKNFAPGAAHKLVVIVSDRKFRPADQFTSDVKFNLVEGDGTAIMTGWSIINCP